MKNNAGAIKFIIIFILILFLVSNFTSCHSDFFNLFNNKIMVGDFNVLGRKYEFTDGTAYEVRLENIAFENFTGEVTLNDTLRNELIITTDDNIFSSLSVKKDDENGIITISGNTDYKYSPSEFGIEIGKNVENIKIDGTYDIDLIYSSINNLTIELNGAVSGSVTCDFADTVTLKTGGATEAALSGRAKKLTVTAEGVSKISGFKMSADAVEVNAAGSSTAEVTANAELAVEITGEAKVYYRGAPVITKREIFGLGELISAAE